MSEKIIIDLHEIAIKHGIKEFVKVEKGDQLCEWNGEDSYINRSYVCGNDRIELGIYENKELLIASFFHELGHITDTKNGYYNSEEKAWEIGFKLAEKYGYKFSAQTYKWAQKELETYVGYK